MCKCVVVSAIFALLGIAVLAIGLILGFAVFDVLIDDYIREVCIDVVVIVLIIIRSVFAQNNDNCGRRYKKSIIGILSNTHIFTRIHISVDQHATSKLCNFRLSPSK